MEARNKEPCTTIYQLSEEDLPSWAILVQGRVIHFNRHWLPRVSSGNGLSHHLPLQNPELTSGDALQCFAA